MGSYGQLLKKMDAQQRQEQEEQSSIQTQLNDLQKEVRSLRATLESHAAQPHQQRNGATAARPAENARAAANTVEAARRGVLQLGEAILDMLLEGMQEKRRVGLGEITRRTGLPDGGRGAQKDWPAWCFVQKLVGEHRAMHAGQGRYELSQAELKARSKRDDGDSPETIAHLGVLQVEQAILDCLRKGVPPADIADQLQLPVHAIYFLRQMAVKERAARGG